eukprot:2695920-Prymnesium_polylepis.2
MRGAEEPPRCVDSDSRRDDVPAPRTARPPPPVSWAVLSPHRALRQQSTKVSLVRVYSARSGHLRGGVLSGHGAGAAGHA